MLLLFNVNFGSIGKRNRSDLEDLIKDYIDALRRVEQVCGDSFITLTKGCLNAHVLLGGKNAFELRYHSNWGRNVLKKLIQAFGRSPKWVLLDDDVPKRRITWKKAPSLFLLTHAYDWALLYAVEMTVTLFRHTLYRFRMRKEIRFIIGPIGIVTSTASG